MTSADIAKLAIAALLVAAGIAGYYLLGDAALVLRVPAVDKHGNSLSIAFTVAMLYGADGKVSAIASIIRDETARFNDERALKKRVAELEAQVAAKT